MLHVHVIQCVFNDIISLRVLQVCICCYRVLSRDKQVMAEAEESEYFNVLLLGRTGFGKSTTGNKLIEGGKKPGGYAKRWKSVCTSLLYNPDDRSEEPVFKIGHGTESCTSKCEVLSSNTVRVIDVPGFGTTDRVEGITVNELNLSLVRCIIRIRDELKIKIARVLYFIPFRGVPRKADGPMREELECLQYYFGNTIFNSMVIVATYDPYEDYLQERGFRDVDMTYTQTTLRDLFMIMPKIDGKAPCVPPVIFLSMNDSPAKVYAKVEQAKVSNSAGLELSVVEETCIKCSVRVTFSKPPANRKPMPISVTHPSGRSEPYTTSKCHPLLVPKYSTLSKVLGGMVYILTMGMVYAFTDALPGFTNSDEECIHCKHTPGSANCKGCLKVEDDFAFKGHILKVLHSSRIEYICEESSHA